MNAIITTSPTQLPIYPDRPLTRPVVSVADSKSDFADVTRQLAPTYVYRGELLDPVVSDNRYRPQLNLQIDPQNRRAIDSYQRAVSDPPIKGLILDGFI